MNTPLDAHPFSLKRQYFYAILIMSIKPKAKKRAGSGGKMYLSGVIPHLAIYNSPNTVMKTKSCKEIAYENHGSFVCSYYKLSANAISRLPADGRVSA